MLIVDPQTCTRCPPERVGELWVRGPEVAAGYWRRPEETRSTFAAQLASGDGPFLRTGELGFCDPAAGIVVCGRLKDLIIVRGRNLHPNDIEETLETVDPAVRPGCAAASPLTADNDEERVGIAVEVRADNPPAGGFEDLAARLGEAVLAAPGVSPAVITLLHAGQLRKTTSGKLQRRATRAALQAGELAVVAQVHAAPPEPIYLGLADRTSKLDARSTYYQFDREHDLPWDKLSAPGILIPAGLASSVFGSQHAALRDSPLWSDIEQLLAMATPVPPGPGRRWTHWPVPSAIACRCQRVWNFGDTKTPPWARWHSARPGSIGPGDQPSCGRWRGEIAALPSCGRWSRFSSMATPLKERWGQATLTSGPSGTSSSRLSLWAAGCYARPCTARRCYSPRRSIEFSGGS